KHMLGDFTTSQVTTGVYTHTFTPGSLKGKSLTIQKGVEKTDETVQALTFHGCKIPSWELSVSVDGYLELTVEVDAEDVEDDTALAAASIGTIKNFHFAHATISKDSTPIAGVSDAAIRGTNALNVERWFLGTAGLKEEPLENGLRTLAGDLSAEFRDMATFYEAFEADTSMELVLAFVGDPIGSTTVTEGLTITLSDVRLTGEAPKVGGPEPAVQSTPFEAYEVASGSSITITYTTSDSAPCPVAVVRVEGLAELRRELRRLESGQVWAKELREANKEAAEKAVPEVRRRAPVLTGALQRTVRALATQRGGDRKSVV